MEIARERQLLGLGGAGGGNTGDLQRKPQPQRAEVTRQFRRQIGGRWADLRFAQRAYVLAAGAERFLQESPVANQRGAGAVGQEQCLVRVERDAVGLLDAAEEGLAFVA